MISFDHRVWNCQTYKLETTINSRLEGVLSICCLSESNIIALGYDKGSIVVALGEMKSADQVIEKTNDKQKTKNIPKMAIGNLRIFLMINFDCYLLL